MRRGTAAIVAERERMQRALTAAGVVHTPSQANFVFVAQPVGARRGVRSSLLAAGLIVRLIRVGEGHFRITVGKPADNDRMLAELTGAGG